MTFSVSCTYCSVVVLTDVPQLAEDEIVALRQHLQGCTRVSRAISADADPSFDVGAALRHFAVATDHR